MSERGLTKTGIKGLDSILLGGIPRTNVILVQGGTGSGKTLMGLEFIYRGITEFNEPGLIIVFETNPDKLTRDAAGFGWTWMNCSGRKSCKSSLPVRKCSIRNCVRRTACCSNSRARWAPSGFS